MGIVRTLGFILLLLAPAVAAGADEGVIYLRLAPDGVAHLTNEPRGRPGFRAYFAVIAHNPVNRDELILLAKKHSRAHDLDWRLVQAVIEVESGFNPTAVSSAGAQGLMQIMPETQKELGVSQPFHAEQNIAAGVRYLKQQMVRFKDLRLALAAYNAGPARVQRYGGVPPFTETRNYVRNVMSRYQAARSSSGPETPSHALQP